MKSKLLFKLVPAVVAGFIFAASLTPAYSGQNHSRLPYRWTFDQGVVEKIEKNLARKMLAVGLSSFEQNVLEKYGIRVGQTFMAQINDELMSVTRTNSGLWIEGNIEPSVAERRQQLPIRRNYELFRS